MLGGADAYCWVLRGNPRALTFYTRHGFRLDGAEKHEPFFDAEVVRLVRRGSP